MAESRPNTDATLINDAELEANSAQSPHEDQAIDLEANGVQNSGPSAFSDQKDAVHSSVFGAFVDLTGKITLQKRVWLEDMDYSSFRPAQTVQGVLIVTSDHGPDPADPLDLATFLKGHLVQLRDDALRDVRSRKENKSSELPPPQNKPPKATSPEHKKDGESFFSSLLQSLASQNRSESIAERIRVAEERQPLFNIWQLQKLFRKDENTESSTFMTSTYILEPADVDPTERFMLNQEKFKPNVYQSSTRVWHHGISGGDVKFWETCCRIRVFHTTDNFSVVTMAFPAQHYSSLPQTPDPQMVTLLRLSFEKLLMSTRSSLGYLADTNSSSVWVLRLIILDLLRASMFLWQDFLRTLNGAQTLPYDRPLPGYEEDPANATAFAASLRHLQSCVSFLLSAILSECSSTPGQKIVLVEDLVQEVECLETELQNSVQQTLNMARTRLEIVVAESSASQDLSVKRLTAIAAIFLPLSLASSLLAMSGTVPEMGRLWYHWLGLWITMGFAILVTYSAWEWIDTGKRDWTWGRLYALPGDLLKNLILSWPPVFPWLIIPCSRVVASFWVGMLYDVRQQIQVLKMGSLVYAGLLGLYISWLIARALFKCFRFYVDMKHWFRTVFKTWKSEV